MSSSPTAGHDDHIIHDTPEPTGRGRWLALIVVCFAQFMVVLDATITNVALPTIGLDLKMNDNDLSWVINSYTLAFGGLLLLGGRLSDLLGRRRIFVIGTLLFAVASLANGLAWSPESIIIFRAIQGIGAAMISPAALSVIMTTFEEGPDRTKALGVWSAIAAGGAAFGLLLGGIITQYISWEWIFFINVPIGLAVIFAAFKYVPESHADVEHRSFDLGGAISVTVGLMLLVYSIVITADDKYGFTAPRTIICFLAAVTLLVAFFVIEARTKAPLVRLGLLKVRSLAVSNGAMLIVSAGMFAFFFFATLYTQQVLGFKPVRAGLAFLPFAFGIGIGAGTAQLLMRRFDVRGTATVGLVLAAGGLTLMGLTLAVDGTYWWLFAGIVPMAIGLGWTFVPFTLIATTNVADEEAGLASGIFNTSQQIGGAIGLAILATVSNTVRDNKIEEAGARANQLTGLSAAVDGFEAAMLAGAGLIIVALIINVTLLRRQDVENIDVTEAAPVHVG